MTPLLSRLYATTASRSHIARRYYVDPRSGVIVLVPQRRFPAFVRHGGAA